MKRVLAAALAAFALPGCLGYQWGEPTLEGADTVAVPIARNLTFRRGNEFGVGGHEFDLTREIRNMVEARTGYMLADEREADLVARVDILAYNTPFLVEDPEDRPLVSNVSIEIKLTVKRRDGTVAYEGTRRENGYLVNSRAEDEGVARAEAYEKLARWVVSRLSGGW